MLIDQNIDEDAKGKTVEALAKSRQIRSNFIARFGLVPCSILKHSRQDRAIDHAVEERSYEKTSHRHLAEIHGIVDEARKRAFETSRRGVRGSSYPALSRFSQNVGRIITEFYCPKKGIVFDPFAGHNSRMQLVYNLDRHYVGFDISKTFMEANKAIREELLERDAQSLIRRDVSIQLFEQSSAKTPLASNYYDFTITSPPYWDIEYYGDEPEQLGKNKTYWGFMDAIGLHIRENYRVLKPHTYCCWFVNDFRKDGQYYPYHSDLIPYFEDAGFKLHTIYIVDLGQPVNQAFVQVIEKTMIFPKQHEYCMVFKKGG